MQLPGLLRIGIFYPDCILSVFDEDQQNIVFVDPKGILHSTVMDDPKLNFYSTIKDLEQRMRNENKVHSNTAIPAKPITD